MFQIDTKIGGVVERLERFLYFFSNRTKLVMVVLLFYNAGFVTHGRRIGPRQKIPSRRTDVRHSTYLHWHRIEFTKIIKYHNGWNSSKVDHPDEPLRRRQYLTFMPMNMFTDWYPYLVHISNFLSSYSGLKRRQQLKLLDNCKVQPT
jgi:hypothetical protein